MKLLLITLLFISPVAFAKKKVIYKYKEYEKFDLGDLEITGDLSVKERRRKTFERNLLQRKSFDREMIQDIKFLR